jgi:hypothetical protein
MLTTEEERALNFNLSLRRRAQACKAREYLLTGNEGAKKALTDRLIAITKEQNSEQRQKIQYSEKFDYTGCRGDAINGDHE